MKQDMTVKTSNTGIAALGNGPTVLGQAQARIPIGGKVRPGIMVLTKNAAQNQDARALYEKHRRAGMPFQEINRLIKESCKLQRNPMTPKNVPYFTVRPGDFKNPAAAQIIMDKYAGDKGDSEGIQLYRFPVIFPVDNWQAVMPHEFACYTAGEKKYWSEYSPDGTRMCKQRAQVEMTGRGDKQKAHRPAGGRQAIPRADNGGVCNPDECPQYQKRECTLTGRLIFHIPGVPGADAIELATRSFYALSEMRQTMEMVSFLHGRISGTVSGRPIFYITKKRQRVSMIDQKTGKPKRVEQWIIAMEADIDMASMYQANETPAMLESGQEAAAALTVDDVPEFDDETGEVMEPIEGDLVTSDEAGHAAPPTEEQPEQTQDQAPATSNQEADLMLMIEDASNTEDLTMVAGELSGIEDKAMLERIRHAMQDKYEAINSGAAA